MLKTRGVSKWITLNLLCAFISIALSTSTGSSYIPNKVVHLYGHHQKKCHSHNNIINQNKHTENIETLENDMIEETQYNKKIVDDTNKCNENITVLYLAGYDNEIFELKNSLLKKGEGNELVIHFYLYKDLKYYNLGKIYTNIIHFKQSISRYTHFFYVDSEMISKNWCNNKLGLENLDKHISDEAIGENKSQYTTLYPQKEVDGSYKFILPNEKDLKMKDFIVNLYKNNKLSKLDDPTADLKGKTGYMKKVGDKLFEYPEIIQDKDIEPTNLFEKSNKNKIYYVDSDFLNSNIYSKYSDEKSNKNFNNKVIYHHNSSIKIPQIEIDSKPMPSQPAKQDNVLNEQSKSIPSSEYDLYTPNISEVLVPYNDEKEEKALENKTTLTPIINLYEEGKESFTNELRPSKLISSKGESKDIEKPAIKYALNELETNIHDNLINIEINNSDNKKRNTDFQNKNGDSNIMTSNIKTEPVQDHSYEQPLSNVNSKGFVLPMTPQGNKISEVIRDDSILRPHYDKYHYHSYPKPSEVYNNVNSPNSVSENIIKATCEEKPINENEGYYQNYKRYPHFHKEHTHVPLASSKLLLSNSDKSYINQNKYYDSNILYKNNHILNAKHNTLKHNLKSLNNEEYSTVIPNADFSKDIIIPKITERIQVQWPQAFPKINNYGENTTPQRQNYKLNNILPQISSMSNAPCQTHLGKKSVFYTGSENNMNIYGNIPKNGDISLGNVNAKHSPKYNLNVEIKPDEFKEFHTYYSDNKKLFPALTKFKTLSSEIPKLISNNRGFFSNSPLHSPTEYIDKNILNNYKDSNIKLNPEHIKNISNVSSYFIDKKPIQKIIKDSFRNPFQRTVPASPSYLSSDKSESFNNNLNGPLNQSTQSFKTLVPSTNLETPAKLKPDLISYDLDLYQPISINANQHIENTMDYPRKINVSPSVNKNMKPIFKFNTEKPTPLFTEQQLQKYDNYEKYLSPSLSVSNKIRAQAEPQNLILPSSKPKYVSAQKDTEPTDNNIGNKAMINAPLHLENNYAMNMPIPLVSQKSYESIPLLNAYQRGSQKSITHKNEEFPEVKPSTKTFTPFKNHYVSHKPSYSSQGTISSTPFNSVLSVPISQTPVNIPKSPFRTVYSLPSLNTKPTRFVDFIPNSDLATNQQYTNIPMTSPHEPTSKINQNYYCPRQNLSKLSLKSTSLPKPIDDVVTSIKLPTSLPEIIPCQTIPNNPTISEVLPKPFHTLYNVKIGNIPPSTLTFHQEPLSSNVHTLNQEPTTANILSYKNIKPYITPLVTKPIHNHNWPQNILTSPKASPFLPTFPKPHFSCKPQDVTVHVTEPLITSPPLPDVTSSSQLPFPVISNKAITQEILPTCLPYDKIKPNVTPCVATLNQGPITTDIPSYKNNLKSQLKPLVNPVKQYRKWPQNILTSPIASPYMSTLLNSYLSLNQQSIKELELPATSAAIFKPELILPSPLPLPVISKKSTNQLPKHLHIVPFNKNEHFNIKPVNSNMPTLNLEPFKAGILSSKNLIPLKKSSSLQSQQYSKWPQYISSSSKTLPYTATPERKENVYLMKPNLYQYKSKPFIPFKTQDVTESALPITSSTISIPGVLSSSQLPFSDISNKTIIQNILPKYPHILPCNLIKPDIPLNVAIQPPSSNVYTFNQDSSNTHTFTNKNLKSQVKPFAPQSTRYRNWPQNILTSPLTSPYMATPENKRNLYNSKQNFNQYQQKRYLPFNPQAVIKSVPITSAAISAPEEVPLSQLPVLPIYDKSTIQKTLPKQSVVVPYIIKQPNESFKVSLPFNSNLLTLNKGPIPSTKSYIKSPITDLLRHRNWPQNILLPSRSGEYFSNLLPHLLMYPQNSKNIKKETLSFVPENYKNTYDKLNEKPTSVFTLQNSQPSVPCSWPQSLPSSEPLSITSSVPSPLPLSIPPSIPSSLPLSLPLSKPSSSPSSLPSFIPLSTPSPLPSSIHSSKPSLVPSSSHLSLPSSEMSSDIPINPYTFQNKIHFFKSRPKSINAESNVKYICPPQNSNLVSKYFPLVNTNYESPIKITTPSLSTSQSPLSFSKGYPLYLNPITKYYSPRNTPIIHKYYSPNKLPEQFYSNYNIETPNELPSPVQTSLPFMIPLPSTAGPFQQLPSILSSPLPSVIHSKTHIPKEISEFLLPKTDSNVNIVPSLLPDMISKIWPPKYKGFSPFLYSSSQNHLFNYHEPLSILNSESSIPHLNIQNQLNWPQAKTKLISKHINFGKSIIKTHPSPNSISNVYSEVLSPFHTVSHYPPFKDCTSKYTALPLEVQNQKGPISSENLICKPVSSTFKPFREDLSYITSSTKSQLKQPTVSSLPTWTLPCHHHSQYKFVPILETQPSVPYIILPKQSKWSQTTQLKPSVPNKHIKSQSFPSESSYVTPYTNYTPLNIKPSYSSYKPHTSEQYLCPLNVEKLKILNYNKKNNLQSISTSTKSPDYYQSPEDIFAPITPRYQSMWTSTYSNSQFKPPSTSYIPQSATLPTKWNLSKTHLSPNINSLKSFLRYSLPTESAIMPPTSNYKPKYAFFPDSERAISSFDFPYKLTWTHTKLNLPTPVGAQNFQPLHDTLIKPTLNIIKSYPSFNVFPYISNRTFEIPNSINVAPLPIMPTEWNLLKYPITANMDSFKSYSTYTTNSRPSSPRIPLLPPQPFNDDSFSTLDTESSIHYIDIQNPFTLQQTKPKKSQNNQPLIKSYQTNFSKDTIYTHPSLGLISNVPPCSPFKTVTGQDRVVPKKEFLNTQLPPTPISNVASYSSFVSPLNTMKSYPSHNPYSSRNTDYLLEPLKTLDSINIEGNIIKYLPQKPISGPTDLKPNFSYTSPYIASPAYYRTKPLVTSTPTSTFTPKRWNVQQKSVTPAESTNMNSIFSSPSTSSPSRTLSSIPITGKDSSIPRFNLLSKSRWSQNKHKLVPKNIDKYQHYQPFISQDQDIFKDKNEEPPLSSNFKDASYTNYFSPLNSQPYPYSVPSTKSSILPSNWNLLKKQADLGAFKPYRTSTSPTLSSSSIESVQSASQQHENILVKKVSLFSLHSKPKTFVVPEEKYKVKYFENPNANTQTLNKVENDLNNFRYLNYPHNKPMAQNPLMSNILYENGYNKEYIPRESAKYITYLPPNQKPFRNTNINPDEFRGIIDREGDFNAMDNILNKNYRLGSDFDKITINNEMNQQNIPSTRDKTLTIPNISILKCNPAELNNGVELTTDNPDILIKAWTSKIKIIQPRIVFDSFEVPTFNFEPIVKEIGKYDKDAIENVVKLYVERHYGEPIVLRGVYKFYKPYIIYNVNNEYLQNGKMYIIWPTLCECGCKWFGCQCHRKLGQL